MVGWDKDGNRLETTVILEAYEVPELIDISVEDGPITVDPGESMTKDPPDEEENPPVPVPVLKEEC